MIGDKRSYLIYISTMREGNSNDYFPELFPSHLCEHGSPSRLSTRCRAEVSIGPKSAWSCRSIESGAGVSMSSLRGRKTHPSANHPASQGESSLVPCTLTTAASCPLCTSLEKTRSRAVVGGSRYAEIRWLPDIPVPKLKPDYG
jgi:hypothetical protein